MDLGVDATSVTTVLTNIGAYVADNPGIIGLFLAGTAVTFLMRLFYKSRRSIRP